MTQTFRISDALHCILLNAPKGPNLACPRGSFSIGSGRAVFLLPRNAKLWKETLTQRPDRVTLVWWNGIGLGGLVSAGSRAGSRVWEIDHLYLPTPYSSRLARGEDRGAYHDGQGNYDQDASHLELLEHLVQATGQRCAERIFLRVPSNDPIIDLVRRAGFFPYFEETLLLGAGRGPAQGQASNSHTNGVLSTSQSPRQIPRPPLLPRGEAEEVKRRGGIFKLDSRTPEDEYGLFQLFCAATPSQVRVALGLTFDQWKDARERHSQGRREWVARNDGKLTGWLSLLTRRQVEEGEIMVHPGCPDLLAALMGLALARGSSQRWLVPGYQGPVSDFLRDHAFRQVACYTMLVKTVAARVTTRGMVPVEA